MSWRTVVISTNAKLDLKMGCLVIRRPEQQKIHISEIGTLIIESTAVSITAALMSELVKQKITVIFCDEKRTPIFDLAPYYGSFDTSGKVRAQSNWSHTLKAIMWTAIISEKIHKQSQLLAHYNRPESEKLLYYINELELGDVTNREGHAAKVYFNALFGMDFQRDNTDSINSALNYGYALLLSAFNRQVVSNGYITQLGLFHENMHNKFNLSSDLMEPFRPLVDYMVCELKPTKFETEEKRYMQTLFQKTVFIGGRTETLPNAIEIYTRSVFKAIENYDTEDIRFYTYEF